MLKFLESCIDFIQNMNSSFSNILCLIGFRNIYKGTNVDDTNAVKLISSLHKLISLDLSSSLLNKPNKVGNGGCFELSRLTQLRVLELDENNIGDDGAAFLSILNFLEVLSISNQDNQIKISDIGAGYLSKLRNIRILNLSKLALTKMIIMLVMKERRSFQGCKT